MTPGVGLALFPGDNLGHLNNDSVSTLDKSLRSQEFQSNHYLNDNEQNSGVFFTLKGWRSTQPEHGYCVIFSEGWPCWAFVLQSRGWNIQSLFFPTSRWVTRGITLFHLPRFNNVYFPFLHFG